MNNRMRSVWIAILYILITIILSILFTRCAEAKTVNFELTKEMIVISKYIEECNFNLPKIIADKVAYETVIQCKKNNEPVPLILAIMQTESNFNPMSVSRLKARGLMQVLDKTHRGIEIKKDELHDIAYNIEYGIKIFKDKYRITKNLRKALYCYSGRSLDYTSKVYENIANFLYYRSKEDYN